MKDQKFENLVKKIRSNEAVISVIGLGYVGLPLALFCKAKSKMRSIIILKVKTLKKGIDRQRETFINQ